MAEAKGTGDDILLRFGVIADVQYADCDNSTNFSKTVKRYFRNALTVLEKACDEWSLPSPDGVVAPSFVAQLGDLIDGRNRSAGESAAALATIQGVVSKCAVKDWCVGRTRVVGSSSA